MFVSIPLTGTASEERRQNLCGSHSGDSVGTSRGRLPDSASDFAGGQAGGGAVTARRKNEPEAKRSALGLKVTRNPVASLLSAAVSGAFEGFESLAAARSYHLP